MGNFIILIFVVNTKIFVMKNLVAFKLHKICTILAEIDDGSDGRNV